MNSEQLTRKFERMLKSSQTSAPYLYNHYWTFHALARMKVRGIQLDWVVDALDAPGRPTDNPETFKHIGEMASAIVNRRTHTIVTVGHGQLNEEGK